LALASELGFSGPITRVEWNASQAVTAAAFGDLEITLCETPLSELTTSFAGNYGSNQPALVYTNSWEVITTTGDQWFGFDCSPSFSYGGSQNLIVEMRWRNDNEKSVLTWHFDTAPAARNNSAGEYNAETGKLGDFCSRLRVTYEVGAVAPTSLGRLRALFR